jgi:hypothetical protein
MAVTVSGAQSGTWSANNNPYQVVGDVTVPAGEILNIQPGVLVEITGDFYITAAGSIIAIGTEADSIRFVNPGAPSFTFWNGIRLESTTATSIFGYCYIEDAEYGINSIDSPFSVVNSHLYHNTKGLHTYAIGNPNPPTVYISDCRIESNGENGILISQNSNTQILQCQITNNGLSSTYRGAIQLSNQSSNGSNDPIIAYNHIYANKWQGITAWDVVGANAINPTIHHNLIEGNLTGVYLLNASGYLYDNVIRNNFIPGDMNSGAGVMVSGATSEPYFERNIVTGNFTGFYITNNARPCLGNMSIYHAWAQGENVIRNNIDANNVSHSVVCATYSQSANIISAENNYWDFNDAAGIASYITDHSDSAALPTIDFEPFLTYSSPITISGSYSYTGVQTLGQVRMELVSFASGTVLGTYPINSNQFSFEVTLAEDFYPVLVADIQNSAAKVYGCSGGINTPTPITPVAQLDLGTIEMTDLQPWLYEKIGAPTLEDIQIVYPLQSGFFVYSPSQINYLYEDTDYVYLKRHTAITATNEYTYNLPPNSIWQRTSLVGLPLFWQKTEVTDTLGTIRVTDIDMDYVWPIEQYNRLLSRQRLTSGQQVSQTYYDEHYATDKFYYEGDHLRAHYEVEELFIDTPDNLMTLSEGSQWRYHPMEIFPYPRNLCFNTSLYWQPPAVSNTVWTGYRVYWNVFEGSTGTIYEIPFEQTSFDILGYNYPYNRFYVTAFNDQFESPATNYIEYWVGANEDELMAPPVIKYGPNPFMIGRDEHLNIDVSYSKAGKTELRIYNLKGQLVNKAMFSAAKDLNFRWDGRDARSRKCAAGIYFIEIKHDKFATIRKKLILMK